MPGGDRTGPMGLGPMTGRGAGYCAGFAFAGYVNPVAGRGFWGWGRGNWGWGRGGGWGRGRWLRWCYAPGMVGWPTAAVGWPAAFGSWSATPYISPFSAMTRQQELDALKGQAKYFEDVLDGLRKRIEQLEAGAQGTAQDQRAENA
ncbi:MAG: DUF5320 domain-containing protein [Pirellulales bacterium]|nr:DUF5320 domain-containing protein [Pirellulales bacterium]